MFHETPEALRNPPQTLKPTLEQDLEPHASPEMSQREGRNPPLHTLNAPESPTPKTPGPNLKP